MIISTNLAVHATIMQDGVSLTHYLQSMMATFILLAFSTHC